MKRLNKTDSVNYESRLEIVSNALALKIFWKENFINIMYFENKTKEKQDRKTQEEIKAYIKILQEYLENYENAIKKDFTFLNK